MSELLTSHDLHIVKQAQKVFRALNHKLRVKILETIEANGNRIKVTDLYIILRIEQSVCSQHLAILRGSWLVTTERDGKEIYYSVYQQRLIEIVETAKELVKKGE